MLDIPIKSTQATKGLMFEAFSEHIPPRHTPVTIVLTVVEKDEPAEKEAEKEKAEPEDKDEPAPEEEEAEPAEEEKEGKGKEETSKEPEKTDSE
jgi:hypothetical protein